MAEFVVAHILDDHQVGDRFTRWPLHVTVVPPFEVTELSQVEQACKLIIQETPQIELQVGDQARFGGNLLVQKLFPSPELSALHTKLIQMGEMKGWKVNGRYTGNYYTPHITQKAGRSYEASRIIMDSLAIVENIGQGYRIIRKEIPLGAQV